MRVHDITTGAPKRNSCCGNEGSGSRQIRQRASCVQIFTLLLSILACLLGIFALLVASRKIKLNGKLARLYLSYWFYVLKNDIA